MSYGDVELIILGSRFSTQRLLEQGGVSVALSRAHQEELGGSFPSGKIDELEGYLTEMRPMFEKQAEAKTTFRTGNAPVESAINEAKKWISDLILTADNAFEEDEDIRDQFHLGGKIGRSVPKITGRMQALLAAAEKYKDTLADWGFSEKDLKEGRNALNDLIEKDKEQELAVKALPKATQELYILKAKAYLLLKRLARAARKVFRGDPAVSDKFQLGILRRSGHKREEASPPVAQS